MQQRSTLEVGINTMMARMDMDEEGNHKQTAPFEEPEPLETYHVYPVPGGVMIVKEDEPEAEQDQDDSTPVDISLPPPEGAGFIGFIISCLGLILLVSSIAFQLSLAWYPPTVTVTLVPKSQRIAVTGTLQLGRVISPLTLSQSKTTSTTGKGHQDAREARGMITIYNGQLNTVTIPAGTVFTSSHGVQIVTDKDATLPPASPPAEGQATITAHAVTTGSAGNISAKDINEACCATAVLAVNLTPFQGGQDERDFQTVTKSDIDRTAQALKALLTRSMQRALQGQLKQGEQLQILPCTPTVSSDHHIGEEARQVEVTSSLTCSAIAFDTKTLNDRATQQLTAQALKRLGSGYSLFGMIQISVSQVKLSHSAPTLVLFLQGTWVYVISDREQERIKSLIKGNTYQHAVQILQSLPGIEKFSIAWDENTKLPKDSRNIHFAVIACV